tara:strand:- start:337 stop:819 length:483 start_codon:yes stop_codon:yes gene_type:complete
MKRFMKDKKGKDTKVEFIGGNKKKTSPKVSNKVPTKLPTKRPFKQVTKKPAFASMDVADAVKRTNKAKEKGKSFTKKGSVVQKSKRSDGVAVGRVIDPYPKKPIKKVDRNQMTAHQKRKDKLRNLRKPKQKVTKKPKIHDAVYKIKTTPKHLQKKTKGKA